MVGKAGPGGFIHGLYIRTFCCILTHYFQAEPDPIPTLSGAGAAQAYLLFEPSYGYPFVVCFPIVFLLTFFIQEALNVRNDSI